MKQLTRASLLCFVLLCVLFPVDAAASSRSRRAAAHSAKCTGSTPCRACKNCRYCKHCAKDGGTCGVCKSGESAARTWQTAAAESSATTTDEH